MGNELVKVLIKGGIGEIAEKKSRFIAHLNHVSSEDEAVSFIKDIKKEYWDAKHNCYAYIIGEHGEIVKFSDDGEPGGSAGAPMLDVLRTSGITDTVAVVTRYFGGVLLGVGGLVRAYQSALKAGLLNSEIAVRQYAVKYMLEIGYSDFQKVGRIIERDTVEIKDISYGENVKIILAITAAEVPDIKKILSDICQGRLTMAEIGETYIYRPYLNII